MRKCDRTRSEVLETLDDPVRGRDWEHVFENLSGRRSDAHQRDVRTKAALLEEVVVLNPRDALPSGPVVSRVLELGDGQAMVQDLDGSPPGTRALLEVIFHGSRHLARDEVPGDFDATGGVIGDLVECLWVQVQVARLAFGAAVLDEHRNLSLRSSHLRARTAPGRHVVVWVIQRSDVPAQNISTKATVSVPIRIIEGGFAGMTAAHGDDLWCRSTRCWQSGGRATRA